MPRPMYFASFAKKVFLRAGRIDGTLLRRTGGVLGGSAAHSSSSVKGRTMVLFAKLALLVLLRCRHALRDLGACHGRGCRLCHHGLRAAELVRRRRPVRRSTRRWRRKATRNNTTPASGRREAVGRLLGVAVHDLERLRRWRVGR